MNENFEVMLQRLTDRQEIYDCLMRYCRGVDRLDREILASAYHLDAIDDHGSYVGQVAGFIDWVLDYHTKGQRRTQHSISNHLCELDGDVAHAESYWTYSAINIVPPYHTRFSGRYLDRLEKRDGRWAIAVRVCVVDTTDPIMDPEAKLGDMRFVTTSRDHSDPSYMRPLMADERRLTP